MLCFLKGMKILIHRNCGITTWYIEHDSVIVFNMDFKCVLKFLRTYVYFTRLQEEKYFIVTKCLSPEN